MYMYIYMGQFTSKLYFMYCYKNALRLNCYNFRTVSDTTFLFSALHSTPGQYCKTDLGDLRYLGTSIVHYNIPWGSNLP